MSAGWPQPPLQEQGSRSPRTGPCQWRSTGSLWTCWLDHRCPTRWTTPSPSVWNKMRAAIGYLLRRGMNEWICDNSSRTKKYIEKILVSTSPPVYFIVFPSHCFCLHWVCPAPRGRWRCSILLGWRERPCQSAEPPKGQTSPASADQSQAFSAACKALLFVDVPGEKPGQTKDLTKHRGQDCFFRICITLYRQISTKHR